MKKLLSGLVVTVFVASLAFTLQQSGGKANQNQPAQKGGRRPPRSTAADAALQRFVNATPEKRWANVQRVPAALQQLHKVGKGDVTKSVVERGSLEPVVVAEIVSPAGDKKDVVTIKWLVKDGSLVKKGDKLVELDTSPVEERIKELEIVVDQAKSRLVNAEKERALIGAIHKSAIAVAKTRLEIAELSSKKYAGPDAHEKQIRKLNVEQAHHGLKLAELQALRERSQIELAFHQRKVEFGLARRRLQQRQRALSQYTIHSPMNGLVVYHVPTGQSRWARGETGGIIAELEPVSRGQKLLRVTRAGQFLVTTMIHEAVVARLRPGQTVQVRVDAYPKEVYAGRVKTISRVASVRDWLSDRVRVYPIRIALTQKTPKFKPGMSVQVTIDLGQRNNVLQLPVQSISILGRRAICFVKTVRGLEARTVTLGLRGNNAVEITAGLKSGEQVLLAPHLVAARLNQLGRPGRSPTDLKK